MKKTLIVLLSLLYLTTLCSTSFSQSFEKIIPGSWTLSPTSSATDTFSVPLSVRTLSANTYFVESGLLKNTTDMISAGAALDLKYFTSIPYKYIQENLPGSTISVTIYIPESAISKDKTIPNKFQLSVKSNTNGNWVQFTGEKKWIPYQNPELTLSLFLFQKSP